MSDPTGASPQSIRITRADGLWDIREPINQTLGAGDVVKVFDSVTAGSEDRKMALLVIQNVGTGKLLYAYNSIPTIDTYHGIIPADSSWESGNGGCLNVECAPGRYKMNVQKLYILAVDRTKVAVTKCYRTDVF